MAKNNKTSKTNKSKAVKPLKAKLTIAKSSSKQTAKAKPSNKAVKKVAKPPVKKPVSKTTNSKSTKLESKSKNKATTKETKKAINSSKSNSKVKTPTKSTKPTLSTKKSQKVVKSTLKSSSKSSKATVAKSKIAEKKKSTALSTKSLNSKNLNSKSLSVKPKKTVTVPVKDKNKKPSKVVNKNKIILEEKALKTTSTAKKTENKIDKNPKLNKSQDFKSKNNKDNKELLPNPDENLSKKKKVVDLIKAKSNLKAKPGRKPKLDAELDEEDALVDNLQEDSFADDLDLKLDSDLLETIEVPIKRRPGRPPKNKDLASGKSGISFPGSTLRLPKKEPFKLKKKLSDTLPGTNLASFMSVNNVLPSVKEEIKKKSKDSDVVLIIDPISQEEEEDPSLPSWTPRSWVTREGERLIIRGSELLKEEQFGKLQDVSNHGVISPDQVEEVIRRIRESYKKKTVGKKGE